MNATGIQHSLNALGFGASWYGGYANRLSEDGQLGPRSKDAVARFQNCWNPLSDRSKWLAVDGVPGDQTQKALSLSLYLGGLVSPHFRAAELPCKHCGWINASRELLAADETYRARLSAGGLDLVSVTRCPVHNKSVGGATNSQHQYGSANDIPKHRHLDEIRPLRVFSGLEISSDGWIVHADVRHAIPGKNFTGSSVSNPAVFRWPTTLLEMVSGGWECRS